MLQVKESDELVMCNEATAQKYLPTKHYKKKGRERERKEFYDIIQIQQPYL